MSFLLLSRYHLPAITCCSSAESKDKSNFKHTYAWCMCECFQLQGDENGKSHPQVKWSQSVQLEAEAKKCHLVAELKNHMKKLFCKFYWTLLLFDLLYFKKGIKVLLLMLTKENTFTGHTCIFNQVVTAPWWLLTPVTSFKGGLHWVLKEYISSFIFEDQKLKLVSKCPDTFILVKWLSSALYFLGHLQFFKFTTLNCVAKTVQDILCFSCFLGLHILNTPSKRPP